VFGDAGGNISLIHASIPHLLRRVSSVQLFDARCMTATGQGTDKADGVLSLDAVVREKVGDVFEQTDFAAS